MTRLDELVAARRRATVMARMRELARGARSGRGERRAADDNPGEESATVDGVTFERGAKLLLAPGTDRDPTTGCSTVGGQRSSESTPTTTTGSISR
jgi:hypothetical protein